MEDNKDKRGEIMSFEDRKIQTQIVYSPGTEKTKYTKWRRPVLKYTHPIENILLFHLRSEEQVRDSISGSPGL